MAVAIELADRNLAGLFGFGDAADEIDVEQAVLDAGTGHLDMVGELEAALEGAGGNALIKHFGLVSRFAGGFIAANGERAFLHFDIEFLIGEARDRDRNPVGVVAGALDIVRRVGRRRAVERVVEQRKHTVEADRGAVKGSEVETTHDISSC